MEICQSARPRLIDAWEATALIESANVLSNLALIYINGGQPKPLPGEQGLPDELARILRIRHELDLAIT